MSVGSDSATLRWGDWLGFKAKDKSQKTKVRIRTMIHYCLTMHNALTYKGY